MFDISLGYISISSTKKSLSGSSTKFSPYLRTSLALLHAANFMFYSQYIPPRSWKNECSINHVVRSALPEHPLSFVRTERKSHRNAAYLSFPSTSPHAYTLCVYFPLPGNLPPFLELLLFPPKRYADFLCINFSWRQHLRTLLFLTGGILCISICICTDDTLELKMSWK